MVLNCLLNGLISNVEGGVLGVFCIFLVFGCWFGGGGEGGLVILGFFGWLVVGGVVFLFGWFFIPSYLSHTQKKEIHKLNSSSLISTPQTLFARSNYKQMHNC